MQVMLDGTAKAVAFPECLARGINHVVFVARGLSIILSMGNTDNRSRMGIPLSCRLLIVRVARRSDCSADRRAGSLLLLTYGWSLPPGCSALPTHPQSAFETSGNCFISK